MSNQEAFGIVEAINSPMARLTSQVNGPMARLMGQIATLANREPIVIKPVMIDPWVRLRRAGCRFRLLIGAKLVREARRSGSIASAAKSQGLARKTVARWLQYGRQGVEPFAQFAQEFDAVMEAFRLERRRRAIVNEKARAKASYREFKASRQAWWLKTLGEREFKARRVKWLRDRGLDEQAAAIEGQFAQFASGEAG